jgi:hypothetical protein
MRDKNEQALLFWSVSTQRMCLRAWLEWLRGRQQKRQRYALVLEQRQLHVLRSCAASFVRYAVDARSRRLQITRHLKQAYAIDKAEIAFKYFHIWRSKCSGRWAGGSQQRSAYKAPNLVSSRVPVNVTLEARDKYGDVNCAPVVSSDKMSHVRAPPRKPAFLLDSVDVSNTGDAFQQPKSAATLSTVPTTMDIQLLPPSVFATPRIPAAAAIDTQHPLHVQSSHSSSMQNRKEASVHFEVDRQITKMSSVPNLHLAVTTTTANSQPVSARSNTPALSERHLCKEQHQSPHQRRSAPSQVPPKRQLAESNSQLELIELKKRLEGLAITSEKLK